MDREKIPVVILVGGLGTRLRQAVEDVPKPMAPVAGRPFLAYLIDFYRQLGFQKFLLLSGYKHETIIDHFKDGADFGVQIEHHIEEVARGTGGAVWDAREHIAEDHFVLCNGDTLLQQAPPESFWEDLGSDIVRILGVDHPDGQRFGSLVLNSAKTHITSFKEKVGGSGVVNSGLYFCSRDLLSQFNAKDKKVSLETDVFPEILKNQPLPISVTQQGFTDMGIPSTYAELCFKEQLKSCSPELRAAVAQVIGGGVVYTPESPVGLSSIPLCIQYDSKALDYLTRYATLQDVIVTSHDVVSSRAHVVVTSATKSFLTELNHHLSTLSPLADFLNDGRLNRPGLFLDRDGVIINYVSYLDDPSKVKLRTPICELIGYCNASGIPVVMVTNQAGIAKQKFSLAQMDQVQSEVKRQLAKKGLWIDETLEATYHSVAQEFQQSRHPALRKPQPGMILEAMNRLRIAPSKSILIGDRPSDLEASQRAQVATHYAVYNPKYGDEMSAFLKGESSYDLSDPEESQSLIRQSQSFFSEFVSRNAQN